MGQLPGWTYSPSLLLHIGSGWVFVAENLSFSTLPDMSNTTVLLPANTAQQELFIIISALLLLLLFQPRGCRLRN